MTTKPMPFWRVLWNVALFLCVTPASADPMLCERAARAASEETGVSLALLRAIMLAESGRDAGQGRAPWPWTLHSQGKGHWLGSREETLALARDLMAGGETNIDIGCFQINLHWHGSAFPSIEAMLDPDANARHAARFLSELHLQTGDWRSAAGAYHSRNPDRAEGYVARLVALHESPGNPAPTPSPAPPRTGPVVGAAGPIVVLGSLAGPLIGGLR